jgi:hypothetical protein
VEVRHARSYGTVGSEWGVMYVCVCMYICVDVCVWERGSSSASPYLICSGVEKAVTGKLLTTVSVTLTHAPVSPAYVP